MRGLLAMLAVCGISCMGSAADDDSGNDNEGPEPGGFSDHDGCQRDSACATGELCTRSGACLPASEVRAIHVTWTLSGQPADANTCRVEPRLRINIHASIDSGRVSYAPVPCVAGKFTVDKLPRSFDQVELGRERGDAPRSAMIDAAGEAALDLPF
jgi:hypothetical protein